MEMEHLFRTTRVICESILWQLLQSLLSNISTFQKSVVVGETGLNIMRVISRMIKLIPAPS